METFTTENQFGGGEVRSWASILDDNCRKQAEAISRVPIVRGHLALMRIRNVGRVMIECRHRTYNAGHDSHWVCITSETAKKHDHLLVQHGVSGHTVLKFAKLD